MIPTKERRASVRHPVQMSVAWKFPPACRHLSCLQATTQDLSSGGVSLVVPQWFGTGTMIRVELQGASAVRTLDACVMHATLQKDGTWFLGCAWVTPLSPDELKELL
jgi:hypothetical protein